LAYLSHMPILSELSVLIKRKRTEMGLSQDRLAQLAGLSRATVNELETGKIGNLSLVRAERLANVLGYGIGVTGARRPKDEASNALETAARTASVSYGEPIPPETLRASLLNGVVAPACIPQLRALLDEAPIGLLSAVVSQLEHENGAPRQQTWQKMRQLAASLACSREIWS
jgi:transcriptional regulator with XRE-family HTH domain